MGEGRLTPSQLQCLRMSRDMSDYEIARELNIHPGTVNKHISAAMRRLGVHDRRAARRVMGMVDNPPGVADPIPHAAPIDLGHKGEVRLEGGGRSTTGETSWLLAGPFRIKGSLTPMILTFCLLGLFFLAGVAGLMSVISNSLNPISAHHYGQEMKR